MQSQAIEQLSDAAREGLGVFLAELGYELPPPMDPLDGVPDVTFPSVVAACAFDPETYQEQSMRWEMRHRHENGLIECGAVREFYHKPDQRRPTTEIVHRLYFAWKRGIGQKK
jgi:hypothetical protein